MNDQVSVLMDTSALSLEELKYLPLLREVLVESPIRQEDGSLLPFEAVVAELNRAWLSHGCSQVMENVYFQNVSLKNAQRPLGVIF